MKKTVIGFCLMFILNITLFSQHQDCNNPLAICDMGSYRIESVKGIGVLQDNLSNLSCSQIYSVKETNSYWMEWTTLSEGTMTFVIDPMNIDDDYDFVLFERDNDCNSLKELRCMASGEEIGSIRDNSSCKGSTGLSIQSIDEFEKSGCKYDDDNFLKMLSTDINKNYVLWINNFNSDHGFTITLEGEAILMKSKNCTKEELIQELDISRIYPNPSKDYINVEYKSASDIPIKIEILNLEGKLIFTNSFSPSITSPLHTLDIKDIPAGSYLLRFKQGENSTIKQFIKA